MVMECWDGPGLPALNMMQDGRTEDLGHIDQKGSKSVNEVLSSLQQW